MKQRVLMALGVWALIYGLSLGIGSILYTTGAISTGATHNDCEGIRKDLAERYGLDEHDVPQEQLKAQSVTCLESHELTARDAFRTEYLFWSLWPGLICAVIIIAWPWWARALHGQEQADLAAEASRLEMGQ